MVLLAETAIHCSDSGSVKPEAERNNRDMTCLAMQATESPFINAIFDREPLDQFVWGRVVLLAEAAHPFIALILILSNLKHIKIIEK